ncbi:UDP-4-amino-4,6-dideoxy-N-acetyl-beta-L-altrosamine transaminase [Desulfonema magnum]|uniref:UDP-4-amino-4, 6-dideoxy-N-acetyl-beta-L-altrosamine transaminase n=1 Tax=Desulfonema magnum TaxID=45655 RepID=A0A975GNL5_9BACT|nr:UDP-4-amino-4,6-dideoxy-N-acetyl-beta-L-altrosamine transaminase [Desulfonema magnum]QTA87897.1 UDP-4-amino-4,6-dideoxy-N-acetyl-beta-L-altrosamine transaminase [Desulfonema magnum]
MNKSYSYGKQYIEKDDIQAVIDVLKSDWLTQGPTIGNFEKLLCEKLGSSYATAVANGTAALHLMALALGWMKGDVVLTTPITFLATANSVLYAKAIPDFVDIDGVSYTVDIDKLEDKIEYYQKKGKKIKAVVAVDYAGHPCEWKQLRFLADKYEFQLINDACHAIGAMYKNEHHYISMYADTAILSFHPVKHITTGEGGAILTNSKEFQEKVKILRTHGMTKDENRLEKNDGPWYYEMHELGFNYRITDIQCALGISQLKKLERFIQRRQEIAHYYDSVFEGDERFIIPQCAEDISHAYHLYPLQIRFDRISITKKALFERLRGKNIYCQVHYIPIHLQPYYRKNFGFQPGDFPVAEKFYEQEMSIPVYPQLETEDLEYISSTIKMLAK